MKRSTLVLLILFVIIIGALLLFDFSRDDAYKAKEDLYKTVTERGYVIVGVKTNTKPFGYTDASGKIVGFDVDIAHQIAKAIFHDENKVKLVPVTESNRIYLLNLSELDMVIATFTITQTRRMSVDFSKPYYLTGQALMVRTGSPIRSIADLSDEKVGVIFGSTAEQTLKMLLPTAKVLGYKSYKDAYLSLKQGNINAIAADDAILRDFSLSDSSVRILPKRYSKDFYGIAFRKTDESNNMIKVINTIISDLDKQGKLNALREKWGLD